MVVVIRPLREQNVLREIFGGDINGAGVVLIAIAVSLGLWDKEALRRLAVW